MTNFDEIDNEIEQWKSNLSAVRENLFALYDHPTYKRLDGHLSELTGQTAALLTPAFAAMNELFSQTDQLTAVIERAANIRHSSAHLPWASRSINEVVELLNGPSIKLPPVSTPLEQRGLLTSSEQSLSITPQELLSAMIKAFTDVKTAVLKVDDAWSRLDPILAAYATKYDALVAMSTSLGDDAIAAAAIGQQQLEIYRTASRTDPLSTLTTYGQMQGYLERLKLQLNTLSSEHSGLKSRLDNAQAKVSEIADKRARAITAASICLQCLDHPQDIRSSVTDEQMAELSDWLAKLVECERQGHWAALGKGLDRWFQLADGYCAIETASVAANEGSLELLAELKGRFSALKVKARKRGITITPEIDQAERKAAGCLDLPLTPLELANRLVTDYENLVDLR